MYIFMTTYLDELRVENVWFYNGDIHVFDNYEKGIKWFIDLTGETRGHAKHFLKKCDLNFVNKARAKYM